MTARRELPPELAGDREQRLVAGPVAVVVVQEPEVVDVDEGDAERRAGGPGALDLAGEVGDERAVVQRPGQRVALGRLDERGGLAGQPALRRAEDQEQQDRGDDGRASA